MINHSENQKYLRAIQGAIFSLGAPLGLIILRSIEGVNPLKEISNNYDIYLYMVFGTMVTFIIFGYSIGKSEDRLETLSIIDSLTGLYNRRYFNARFNDEFLLSQRNKKLLSLAILDIDHFKLVNDQYGHPIGDKVLIAVSNAINNVIRKGETVARIGGEEFAIIFPDCNSDTTLKIIERVRKSVSNTYIDVPNNNKIYVTVSAGISCYKCENSIKNATELFENADKALYKAKETGRNKAMIG